MGVDSTKLPLREQIAEHIWSRYDLNGDSQDPEGELDWDDMGDGIKAQYLMDADSILEAVGFPCQECGAQNSVTHEGGEHPGIACNECRVSYVPGPEPTIQSQDAPSCTNPTCTCSDRQQQGCVCKEADCSHFDGAACQNCGCAIPNTAEPLSDDLRIVVVTRAERGFTADVYGDFNSYGAAKKWAEANIAKKIGYDLKPVTVIAIQSEESIPMPQRDMIEAILRAKDHCAYKPDADRLQWAAEFISKQRPTIPRLQHVQPEKGEEN